GDGEVAVLVRNVAQHSTRVIQETAMLLDLDQLERAIDLLLAARKIDVYGVGASGLAALVTEHKLVRMGRMCHAFTDPHVQAMSAALLGKDDVVIAFSHSGSTKDILSSLLQARERGAATICVTSV